jgi:lipid A 4'-phosphatase
MPDAADLSWRRMAHPWGWLALLVLVPLTVLPQIDLGASAAFYQPPDGFPWRETLLGTFVRKVVPRVIIGSIVLCVAAWLIGLIRRSPVAGMTFRRLVYLLTTVLLGPGLIVETVLKPNWGRARPDDLLQFGGVATYTPPLVIAEACTRNCSFVSGHAAIAFWVTAYAFLVPPLYRARALVAGLIFGSAVGLMRIMQGAHFLSDVIYAGVIVVAVNAIGARLLLRTSP